MKLTSRLSLALLANFGLFVLSSASALELQGQPEDTIFFPCCKETSDGEPYCCVNCCFLRFDCFSDEHCQSENMSQPEHSPRTFPGTDATTMRALTQQPED